MEVSKAIALIASHYNIKLDDLKNKLDNMQSETLNNNNLSNHDSELDIILPFCNVINEDMCKAIVYNHGLYTQCTNITDREICKSCTKLKYGKIYERLRYKKGEFVTSNGKKEVSYEKFMRKQGYTQNQVLDKLNQLNLKYDLDVSNNMDSKTSSSRGRPKKEKVNDQAEECQEIEVELVNIKGQDYLRTPEGVYLDVSSYEIVEW